MGGNAPRPKEKLACGCLVDHKKEEVILCDLHRNIVYDRLMAEGKL